MNIRAMMGAATTTDRRDGARRIAALAGVDRHVFEAAERPESHLAEQVEAHDGHRGHGGRERMERGHRAMRDVQPRQRQQQSERRQHQNAAGLVDPFADAESTNRHHRECREHENVHGGDDPRARRHGVAAIAKNVSEVLGDLQARFGCVQDPEQPQVPGNQKAGQLVEPELRPLIQAAFERHRAVQMNDNGSGRNVKERCGADPEHDVRRPLLRGHADPGETDDEQDLGECEIDDAEVAPQLRAACLNVAFFAFEGRAWHAAQH
jgi:hypothetical protein